jgi:hypothetical protein
VSQRQFSQDRLGLKSDEETDDSLYADRRNFYNVEKWSKDGLRVEVMLGSIVKATR